MPAPRAQGAWRAAAGASVPVTLAAAAAAAQPSSTAEQAAAVPPPSPFRSQLGAQTSSNKSEEYEAAALKRIECMAENK